MRPVRPLLRQERSRGSYLDADLGEGHDAALLIYEDFCALSPVQRAGLLRRTRAALRAGGTMLFDVTAAPGSARSRRAAVAGPGELPWTRR